MTNSSPWFFDGPNRNRWFTVLKKWWIFPLRSVNVITRWYFQAPHHGSEGQGPEKMGWSPNMSWWSLKSNTMDFTMFSWKTSSFAEKVSIPTWWFQPISLGWIPMVVPFLNTFRFWLLKKKCRLNPKTIGWIICFYGGLLTGLASHETELGKPTPQTPAQSAKSGELTIR